MGKRKQKKKKVKVEKKLEPERKVISRPNFTQMALEYRRNESKYLLEKVRKLGYLNKPKVKDVEDSGNDGDDG